MLERLLYSDGIERVDKINAVIDKVNEMAVEKSEYGYDGTSNKARPLTMPEEGKGNSQDRPGKVTWYGDDPHLDQTLVRPMDMRDKGSKSEAAVRKEHPMATGVLDYFPDALYEIAGVSKKGNDQHNPGQPLHWAKGKSTDHADALVRHLKDRGKRDSDGERHSAKVAWRALALLQTEIENERKAGSGLAQGYPPLKPEF